MSVVPQRLLVSYTIVVAYVVHCTSLLKACKFSCFKSTTGNHAVQIQYGFPAPVRRLILLNGLELDWRNDHYVVVSFTYFFDCLVPLTS